MQLLQTIRDKDWGLNIPEPLTWTQRKTGRAVIFNADKNIALLHVSKKHYHKLPGGGVEEGEDVIQALKREAMEEVGCEITNLRELGVIEEYRSGLGEHQISHCFVADVEGKKNEPELTPEEIADGFKVVWTTLDQAIKTLEQEITVEDYEGKFINARELTFLKETQKAIETTYAH